MQTVYDIKNGTVRTPGRSLVTNNVGMQQAIKRYRVCTLDLKIVLFLFFVVEMDNSYPSDGRITFKVDDVLKHNICTQYRKMSRRIALISLSFSLSFYL
jgi:hypothetical protein